MRDRPLFLHWNELSIPADVTANELQTNPQWASQARVALATFNKVRQVRSDCRISLTKGAFHGQVAGRPLQSWLEIWLGKDRWRQLSVKVVQPPMAHDLPPVNQLECELSCNGQCGEGMTRAHIADSWTLSVASEATKFSGDVIRASKTVIDSDAPIDVDVPNLATEDHFERWAEDLEAWGEQLSNNHIVSVLGGYQIIMYPLDHGHPHIHVHVNDDPRLNAKYRVDKFEALTNGNPSELDALINCSRINPALRPASSEISSLATPGTSDAPSPPLTISTSSMAK